MEPYVNYIGLHWKTPFFGWVKTKKSYLRIENELEAHIWGSEVLMSTTTWRNIIPKLHLTLELRTKQYFIENQIYKGILKSSPLGKFSWKIWFLQLFCWCRKKYFEKLFSKRFFWGIYFYEVSKFIFLLHSEQSNISNSRVKDVQKWSKNVSKTKVSWHTPTSPIILGPESTLGYEITKSTYKYFVGMTEKSSDVKKRWVRTRAPRFL